MKFRTTKEKLFAALSETNKIIPIRTTLPILSCVLIKAKKNKIVLTATDLEQTIVTEILSEIPEEGDIAIPGNRLMEIVSALPSGPIEITCKEDKEVEISSPKGVYKIIGKEPSEYPETPQLNSEQQINIKGGELLDIINNTLYAVSKDDLKPALCGIYLNIADNKITAVSTDGHRLVKYEKEVEEKNPEGAIIIPGKFFSILKNNINITGKVLINMSENHIEVTENNTTAITRIIKESFPDFNSVIPDQKNNNVKINAIDLNEAVKRVSIFSNKTTRQIILSFENNEVVVSTEDKETRSSAKEHISCEFEGEKMSIAYNAQYLREVVQHLDNENINVFLGTSRTAAVFKPIKEKEKTNLTALLMPLRTT